MHDLNVGMGYCGIGDEMIYWRSIRFLTSLIEEFIGCLGYLGWNTMGDDGRRRWKKNYNNKNARLRYDTYEYGTIHLICHNSYDTITTAGYVLQYVATLNLTMGYY